MRTVVRLSHYYVKRLLNPFYKKSRLVKQFFLESRVKVFVGLIFRRLVQSQSRPRLLPDVFLKKHSTYFNRIDLIRKQIDWASL